MEAVAEIRLTKKQNEIIYLLQNGYILVTGSDFGAMVSKGYDNRKIRLDVFWKLERMKLLYQNSRHWNFELTNAGEKIKTKPVVIPDSANRT